MSSVIKPDGNRGETEPMNGKKNNTAVLDWKENVRSNQKNDGNNRSVYRVIACVLFVCSVLFAAMFLTDLLMQRFLYSSAENSAPFGVFILKDAIQYLLPSLILLLAGTVLRRADKKLKK